MFSNKSKFVRGYFQTTIIAEYLQQQDSVA